MTTGTARSALFRMAVAMVIGLSLGPLRGRAAADSQPPPSDEERRLLDAATKAYDEGRFVEAANAFAESHRRYGRVDSLFNLGQSHRLAGACAQAERAYRAYLNAAAANAAHRARAERRLAEMITCTAAKMPVAASVGAQANAPAPAPLRPASAMWVEQRETPQPGRWMRPVGLGCLAASLASGLGAAWFAWQGQRKASSLTSGSVAYGPALHQLERDGRRDNHFALGLALAAGLTGALGGTILALSPGPKTGSTTALILHVRRF